MASKRSAAPATRAAGRALLILTVVAGLGAGCAPAASPAPGAAPAAPTTGAAPAVATAAPQAPAAAQPPPAAQAAYPNAGVIVETAALKTQLSDPRLRVVDVRTPEKYAAGHIPGAISVQTGELDETRNDVQDVAPADKVSATLGRLGLGDGQRIVIYDDSRTMTAARLFWVLDYYGHPSVAILNGGFPKWVDEGNEVTRDVSAPAPATFTARADPGKVADLAFVTASLGKPAPVLLDVRAPAEFQGTDKRSARGGHIPGARNLNWESFVTAGSTPVLKSSPELKQLFDAAGLAPETEVVTYCQSGARAAQAYFTLRLMGFKTVRNYDGSWQEWGNDPTTAIES